VGGREGGREGERERERAREREKDSSVLEAQELYLKLCYKLVLRSCMP